jgi:23S rRNA (pseudouridine1915-N3)-methyltransferase
MDCFVTALFAMTEGVAMMRMECSILLLSKYNIFFIDITESYKVEVTSEVFIDIRVVLEGKCRNAGVRMWFNKYADRFSRRFTLELVEWRTSPKARGERFLTELKHTDSVILLDALGKEFDSLVFADRLLELSDKYSVLYLLVGEANGHMDALLSKGFEKWSLSRLTFSYELTLMVLAEQIYRASAILDGHPYHK